MSGKPEIIWIIKLNCVIVSSASYYKADAIKAFLRDGYYAQTWKKAYSYGFRAVKMQEVFK